MVVLLSPVEIEPLYVGQVGVDVLEETMVAGQVVELASFQAGIGGDSRYITGGILVEIEL